MRQVNHPEKQGEGAMMDIVIGIVRAALMVGFIALVVGALACLFMIVFGIATGFDQRIQE